jgi:DNA-binding winged helix-turn-helix (wHTH) protein/tetratricopeptide (TPR) repeat protein
LGGDSPMKGVSGVSGSRAAESAASPLAHRPDIRLGSATVRPSLRTIEGPGGNITTEPRVMQVLLALADAGGAVLSRDDLMRLCWGGAIVGDDSINRAIAEIRRIARATGAGFGVETIPRIGYRLTGTLPANTAETSGTEPSPPAPPPVSPSLPPTTPPAKTTRRRWMYGAALAVAGATGVGIWASLRPRPDPRFLELMEKGRQELWMSLPYVDRQGVEFFREAAAISPGDPAVWGWLALAHSQVAEYARPQEVSAAVQASDQAARRALALDSREPNARVALVLLQRALDDWITTDRKLREILSFAPDNVAAQDALVSLLQSAGYYRESWELNERVIAIDPLRPMPQQRRSLKHWIMGRPAEADKVIARLFELWPSHPGVWNSRLLIYAFTGQTHAARILIDEHAADSTILKQVGVKTWRTSLKALETRSPADIEIARNANLAAATQSPRLSVHAIMVLAELGEVDAAYSLIDGFLLRRGQLVLQAPDGKKPSPEQDPQWRQTMWMFTPATKNLRTDPRFMSLATAIGLAEYWRQRGIEPDEGLPRS